MRTFNSPQNRTGKGTVMASNTARAYRSDLVFAPLSDQSCGIGHLNSHSNSPRFLEHYHAKSRTIKKNLFCMFRFENIWTSRGRHLLKLRVSDWRLRRINRRRLHLFCWEDDFSTSRKRYITILRSYIWLSKMTVANISTISVIWEWDATLSRADDLARRVCRYRKLCLAILSHARRGIQHILPWIGLQRRNDDNATGGPAWMNRKLCTCGDRCR